MGYLPQRIENPDPKKFLHPNVHSSSIHCYFQTENYTQFQSLRLYTLSSPTGTSLAGSQDSSLFDCVVMCALVASLQQDSKSPGALRLTLFISSSTLVAGMPLPPEAWRLLFCDPFSLPALSLILSLAQFSICKKTWRGERERGCTQGIIPDEPPRINPCRRKVQGRRCGECKGHRIILEIYLGRRQN